MPRFSSNDCFSNKLRRGLFGFPLFIPASSTVLRLAMKPFDGSINFYRERIIGLVLRLSGNFILKGLRWT